MAENASGILEFDPSECPEHHLITARSHLIDRFVPDCERILLPAKMVGGGTLRFEKKHHVTDAPTPEKRGLKAFRKGSPTRTIDDAIFLDFRRRNPENWAHFLNNHLPICFALLEETGLNPDQIKVILPMKTPRHIVKAAEFFGLSTICTDDRIEGDGIAFESEPWIGIRSVRAEWARVPKMRRVLTEKGVHGAASDHLPSKVFLSRRDTRNLENEAAVEAHLAPQGFVKIYPEDLSIADQLLLFENAESMVAIHGAGLAPLLFLSKNSNLRTLIEVFPCGHMTDVFRVMAHQVGCNWIGVRGKIKPEHVEPAYDLENPFLQYSLQSFELDLASLDVAFDMV